MSLTIDQAYDEMLAAFKTAWDAGVDSAGLPVLYANRAGRAPETEDAVTKNPTSYVRVTIQHNQDGEQATLTDSSGNKRWRSYGVIVAEIFAGAATEFLWTSLAKTVVSAWRGVTTAGGVIFRRVNTVEVGRDGVHYKVNVTAAFEYDEIA